MKLSSYSLIMIVASFGFMILADGPSSFGWFLNMMAWYVVNAFAVEDQRHDRY